MTSLKSFYRMILVINSYTKSFKNQSSKKSTESYFACSAFFFFVLIKYFSLKKKKKIHLKKIKKQRIVLIVGWPSIFYYVGKIYGFHFMNHLQNMCVKKVYLSVAKAFGCCSIHPSFLTL